ncbi:endonuclease domain-containing protein [Microbacterium sp.]|uniref:endonuclease domain-containing protein n=1 Tax=Microbacterium sp. TaxID=51671 RepID=UPI003C7684AC
MRHRITLPEQLGRYFSVSQAAAAGVGRGRADARDLARPFHGVRALKQPQTFGERVLGYAPRMRPGQRLVGRTAVRWWGMPYPEEWTLAEKLEIAVPQHLSPPRTSGVAGRHLKASRVEGWKVGKVRVVDPVAAVFSCAEHLAVPDAVKLLDALLTDADNYPGLKQKRPLYTLADIEARLRSWNRFKGSATIREALPRARPQVESPKETETRLAIVDAGMPEPVVQFAEYDGRRLVARIDLAYPEWKIAIEYEGDGHRVDKAQWRRDIQRQRELEDRGWIVIRLTQADLRRPSEFLARIRREIASRAA